MPFPNSKPEEKRLKREKAFVAEVNSGSEWAIKLGHQKLSTYDLLDFPTDAKILMPYRTVLSRIKSLLAFNYVLFSQMKKSSVTFEAGGIELITPREIPSDQYLGDRVTIEVSEETKFKYTNLFPERAKGFASSIMESERYVSKLEKGEVEVFLNEMNSLNFFLWRHFR